MLYFVLTNGFLLNLLCVWTSFKRFSSSRKKSIRSAPFLFDLMTIKEKRKTTEKQKAITNNYCAPANNHNCRGNTACPLALLMCTFLSHFSSAFVGLNSSPNKDCDLSIFLKEVGIVATSVVCCCCCCSCCYCCCCCCCCCCRFCWWWWFSWCFSSELSVPSCTLFSI